MQVKIYKQIKKQNIASWTWWQYEKWINKSTADVWGNVNNYNQKTTTHHYLAAQSLTLGASAPSPVPEPGSVHSVLLDGLTAAADCVAVVSSLYFRQPSVVDSQQQY